MRLVFDIETDGLFKAVTQIHCIVVRDLDSKTTLVFNDQGTDQSVTSGITLLEEADWLIGHNIIGYDIPVIKKFYPFFDPPITTCLDTLVLSQLRYPDMIAVDMIRKFEGMPRQLYGRHSLESYGYRLGVQKSDYGKTADWKEWSPEMQAYCIQDVRTTTALWKHFQLSYPGLP